MATLTKRQKQIYDFIKIYIDKNGFAPTFEEIKRRFKLSALSTIHQHIETLAKKGLLKKVGNLARGIELNNNDSMVQVQLLGTIAAGQPLTLFDNVNENIAVPKNKLPNFSNNNVYALKVVGNSMVEENIHDGDTVLVRHQNTAENGQRVVALVNGGATLKKFFKDRGRIRLQPANKTMEPIIVSHKQDLHIQGIILDVIQANSKSTIQFPEAIKKEQKQYPKLPLNKIILGDAIEELKKLPDNSIDIIVADPPYNIGKDFGNDSDKRELIDYINWSKAWISEAVRVMKPNATMFIYGFSEILAHISVELPINKRWLIWHYTNKNVASLNFWQRSHESIICAWKERPIFNRDEVREPYTEGFLNGAAGKIRKSTPGRFSKGNKVTTYIAHENGALPRDVIKLPALAGGAGMNERWFLCKSCNEVYTPRQLKNHLDHNTVKHPTQKPLELTRRLIKSAAPRENSVVLIPFVGSGSECVIAKELGHSYIGFELNPDYIKLANGWIKR